MSAWVWVLLGIALVLFLLYLSMTAGRLDRLHQRVDTSLLSLHLHLLRRSAAATELAISGVLDPASSVLLSQSAHDARIGSEGANPQVWSDAETELTGTLVAILSDPQEVGEIRESEVGDLLLADLAQGCQRVALSRRFHNDAVQACRRLRARPVVRLFRLAGRTPMPETWEMNDSIPPAIVEGVGVIRGPGG